MSDEISEFSNFSFQSYRYRIYVGINFNLTHDLLLYLRQNQTTATVLGKELPFRFICFSENSPSLEN